MNIVTGYAGKAHITSDRVRNFNAAIVGEGKYVVKLAAEFGYEIISNNLIRINSGHLINQGTHACIDINDYEEVVIDNGLQGVNRNDLIVAKYKKNATTAIEMVSLEVIKGTSGGVAVDPEYVTGNILQGAIEDDMPLYRVRIEGLSIVAVEPLFEVYQSLKDEIDTLNSNLSAVKSTADAALGNTRKLLLNAYSVTGLRDLTDKISNYKYILVYLSDGSVSFANAMYPADMLPAYASDTNNICFGIDQERLGNRVYGIATYKSDTQLYVQISSGLSMSIYGIK